MVDTELFHKLMFQDSGLYSIPYRSNFGITTEHTSPAEH